MEYFRFNQTFKSNVYHEMFEYAFRGIHCKSFMKSFGNISTRYCVAT